MADTKNDKNSNSPDKRAQERNIVSSHAERRANAPQGNSPALRFPGFTEPWQKTTLGDCCGEMDYGMNAPAKEYDGQNKYIRITDIDENSSEYCCENIVSPDGVLSDKYLVNVNDILFARTGSSTGKTYLYRPSDGHLYFAGFLIRANVKDDNDSNFIYYQCKLKRYWNWVRIMSARSGQPGINSQEYSTYTIYSTSKEEQSKISSLFKLLDERIATQRRLIEDLEKLKSSIVEKVYCSQIENHPRLRINQKYAEKWPIYELINICTRITTKNINNESNRVLTIAAQYGLIDQRLFFNKVVASENISNYYLLNKGDFAYNKSYSGDYTWGAVKRLDKYDSGVLSPLYICFRPKNELVDSDYLLFYFESKKWHKGISEIVVEGARNHGLLNISVKDFFNMT